MSRGFAPIRAKLARGKERADALKTQMSREIKEWGELTFTVKEDPQSLLILTDPDFIFIPPHLTARPDFRSFSFYLDFFRFRNDHGIVLGEAIHHYRGALDHLAWLLVKRGRAPRLKASAQRQVQFPLAKTRRGFWNNTSRLPGVPREIRAFIELYQPYRRSPIGRTMRAFRDFSDSDKHRTIVPMAAALFEADLEAKTEYCEPVGVRWFFEGGRPFKPGTRFARVAVVRYDPARSRVGVVGPISFVPVLPRGFRLDLFLHQLDSSCSEIVHGCEERL